MVILSFRVNNYDLIYIKKNLRTNHRFSRTRAELYEYIGYYSTLINAEVLQEITEQIFIFTNSCFYFIREFSLKMLFLWTVKQYTFKNESERILVCQHIYCLGNFIILVITVIFY